MTDKFTPHPHLFRLLALVIGLLLLVGIYFYSVNTDTATAEATLSNRVHYIKSQCADFNGLNLASESKSLLRIAESSQQSARDIWYMTGQQSIDLPTQEILEHCVESHYLTGLLLLARDGSVITSYTRDDTVLPQLDEALTDNALLDVTDYPKKTYAVRLTCDDDSYIDVAASARSGVQGIVVAFYHTPAEYVHTYSLSYQHLLAGFDVANDGTLVVSSGDEIVASNDESLLGLSTDDVEALRLIKQRGAYEQMVYVWDLNSSVSGHFGYLEQGRDYYVYALSAGSRYLYDDAQKPDFRAGDLSAHHRHDRAGPPPYNAQL